MSRYIKRFPRIGHALGPSEERGFALWVGYDMIGVDDDLTAFGLTKVDDWTDDELARRGVASFSPVQPEDAATYSKLGIERKP